MSRLKRTVFPANCTVLDSNPHKFHVFMAKRREVFAEYGFTLGHSRVTPEENEGYRRYMRDWRRRYKEEHREKIKGYHREYRKKVLQKGFRNKAEASGDEKQIERISKMERKRRLAVRKQMILEKYGFRLGKKPQTPEELAGWKRYKADWAREYAAAHREKGLEATRRYQAKQKVVREQEFQERMRRLEETDPAAAAKARRHHELMCRIQRMTPEELAQHNAKAKEKRLRRERQRRKAIRQEKRKVRNRLKAERDRQRKAELAAARKAAKAERERVLAEQRAVRRHEREEATQAKRKATRAERRREREAAAAARAEAEMRLEEQYLAEREVRRAEYLERKARGETVTAETAGTTEPAETIGTIETTMTDEVAGIDEAMAGGVGNPPPEDPPTIGGDGDFGDDGDFDDEGDEEDIEAIHQRLEEEARQRAQAEREAARDAQRRARLVEHERKRARGHAEASIAVVLGCPVNVGKQTPRERQRIGAAKKKIADALDAEIERQAQAGRSASRSEWHTLIARFIADADKREHERQEALEKRKAEVLAKYGFILGKKPTTPEEIEGRRRYELDKMAAERERKREAIRIYNNEYRRKRRAEELAKAQKDWTPEQWESWRKRQKIKECPRGSPQWVIREVVRYLAQERDVSEDEVMSLLIECGGVDFLMAGAESLGREKCDHRNIAASAVRALNLYLDPDGAAMFGESGEG